MEVQKIFRENLSENAKKKYDSWENSREAVDRPTWDEYYIHLAFEVSQRSIDAQTKCGCVITDRQHRPLGFGYNSFVTGINDKVLPNLRPDKYDFMIHSELNALFNCSQPPVNGIAYITGPPCKHCLQCLWQAGIREIVFGDNHTKMQGDKNNQAIEEILIKLMRDKGLIYRSYRCGIRQIRNQTV